MDHPSTRHASAPPTRLIRVTAELLDSFGTWTFDGRAMTAEWGEPMEQATEGEPVYEPTFHTTEDGWLDGIRAEAAALDVDRLARALNDSDLMRRYDDYSRDAYPDTMRQTPLDDLARTWAAAIAAAYAAAPAVTRFLPEGHARAVSLHGPGAPLSAERS